MVYTENVPGGCPTCLVLINLTEMFINFRDVKTIAEEKTTDIDNIKSVGEKEFLRHLYPLPPFFCPSTMNDKRCVTI